MSFRDLERKLDAKVAAAKSEGLPPGERATEEERVEAGRARAAAFQGATQGRGKPGFRGSYGTGKPPKDGP